MTQVIELLFGFILLGLVSDRLGRAKTYALMALAIATYMGYAYTHGG